MKPDGPQYRETYRQLKIDPMEHRGIRYTIRAGIERGQWLVAIHPDGVESEPIKISGAREHAEAHAHRLINKWLDGKSVR